MSDRDVEIATRKCWKHHTPLASEHISTIRDSGELYWCPVCGDETSLLFTPPREGKWSDYPVFRRLKVLRRDRP